MSDNTRIAKNTFYLFFRMLVTMGVSLYTSRLVLEALGVENYGIYNVVGGLVAFISYINWGMSSASVRFITFSLGDKENGRPNEVFNNSFGVHLLISAIIILLGETVGIWFFFNELNIPPDSYSGAFVAYQCSIAMTVISILTIPFNSLITAHEHMGVFAALTFVDVALKLGICYILGASSSDRLIAYSLLLLGTQVIYTIFNVVYCRIRFPESKITFRFKKKGMKQMGSFAGWSMVGCTASVAQGQGLNLLLNIYGGPLLNAARGLAVQVQSAVTTFVGSFQGAITPQIIKNYAAKDLTRMHTLIGYSSKYSYFLLFTITLPLLLNLHTVLGLWLKEVPADTQLFLTLIMILALVNVLSNPLMKSADATGKIKRYHLIVGGSMILVLPVAWLGLRLGLPPYSVFVVQIIFGAIGLWLRLYVLKDLISISVSSYCKAVVWPVVKVSVIAVALSLATTLLFPEEGLLRFAATGCASVAISIATIWTIGLDASERKMWSGKIRQIIHRISIKWPRLSTQRD